MFPNNRLSTTPVRAKLLSPDSVQDSPILCFEDGGIAISNPSVGISGFVWQAWIDGGFRIRVKRIDKPDSTAFYVGSVPNATNIGLAFDSNMNVAVSYEISGTVYLYWFDPSVAKYVTTLFVGCTAPKLTHDDKRSSQTLISDVLLFYIRDSKLFYRMQRDRYGIEYLLYNVPANYTLDKVGMGTNYRVQIVLTPTD